MATRTTDEIRRDQEAKLRDIDAAMTRVRKLQEEECLISSELAAATACAFLKIEATGERGKGVILPVSREATSYYRGMGFRMGDNETVSGTYFGVDPRNPRRLYADPPRHDPAMRYFSVKRYERPGANGMCVMAHYNERMGYTFWLCNSLEEAEQCK